MSDITLFKLQTVTKDLTSYKCISQYAEWLTELGVCSDYGTYLYNTILSNIYKTVKKTYHRDNKPEGIILYKIPSELIAVDNNVPLVVRYYIKSVQRKAVTHLVRSQPLLETIIDFSAIS